MSIKHMLCFDLYPTQMDATGLLPVHGAGIVGTPLESLVKPLAAHSSYRLGVSDRPEDYFQMGGTPARSLATVGLALGE